VSAPLATAWAPKAVQIVRLWWQWDGAVGSCGEPGVRVARAPGSATTDCAPPAATPAEFEEIPARVSKYAVFTLKGVLYSVPSQLIGHRLMVRQYAQHVEGWLGGQCVVSLPRARPAHWQRVGRSIDFRHLVGALKCKPGAFARWVLRDAAFPRAVYRQTWERLISQRPEREACKTMVGLLVLAADGHEAQLAQELEQLMDLGQLPDLGALTQLLAPPKGDVPQVVVTLPTLAAYDDLFEAAL
jgi:hypothetical protein